MKNVISKGNSFGVLWSIVDGFGVGVPLSEFECRLFYLTGRGISEAENIVINDNTVSWEFAGADQHFTGEYALELRMFRGPKEQVRLRWNHAFLLSATAGSSTDLVITHTSTLDMLSTAVSALAALDSETVAEGLENIASLDRRVTALEDTDYTSGDTEDQTDYPEIEI